MALRKPGGKICMKGILKSMTITLLGRLKWTEREGEQHIGKNGIF